MKKSSLVMAALTGTLILAALFAGCEQNAGDDSGSPSSSPYNPIGAIIVVGEDHPGNGEMSNIAANSVFGPEGEGWERRGNEVYIKDFSSASALGAYLNMSDAVSSPDTLTINTIANCPVVGIATGAFKPAPEKDGRDDISNVVASVKLPESIKELGDGIFADVAKAIIVAVPENVVNTDDKERLYQTLGRDVRIALADEVPIDTDDDSIIQPVNPSVKSFTTKWENGDLVAKFEYTSDPPPDVTFEGKHWKNLETPTPAYYGNTDVSPVLLTYTINGKTKVLQVSLATKELNRPTGSAATYQIYGFDAANNAVGLRETQLTMMPSENEFKIPLTSNPIEWKRLPSDDTIKRIFDAIYTPNNTNSPQDKFVKGETDKKVIGYDSPITKEAFEKVFETMLRLFYITLDSKSDGTDDKIYIAGNDLPAYPYSDKTNGSKLIIIDIGQPGVDNAGLPTFYIPHQGLGDVRKEYPYIRFRVNKGASAVILADNSGYEKEEGGVGHPCANGYFNNGCIEVMAGGKLRDGAFEGFPLGDNAVILNRTGSYLAIGPEKVDGVNGKPYYDNWYAGWLIGPTGETEYEDKPRIEWHKSNSEGKYIEVRPKDIVIDADVTVIKSVGLIYNVWFIEGTTVVIDVDNNSPVLAKGSNNEDIKGLAVNGDNYKFYGQTGAKIVVNADSYIMKSPLAPAPTNSDDHSFITATTPGGQTIIRTNDTGKKVEYSGSKKIYGYNNWTIDSSKSFETSAK